MNITLLQLRAFVTVSRFGSFTLAADALHRTQPAITMQVKQLEDALNLKLFDRTTRQLRLTATGMALITPFSALLQQLDGAVGLSQDLQAMRAGVVRIACLPSVATAYLPRSIARFRRRYPNVTFSLQDALGDRVIALVKSAEVEFGITDGRSDTAGLDVFPLFTENMYAVFLSGHPIGAAPRVDVDELAKHDLVLTAQGSNARRIVDVAFAACGRVAVPACQAAYMSTAIGMVQAELGVAVLPLAGVQLGVDRRLRVKVINAPGFVRQIAIVRLSGRSISPAAEAFMKNLRRYGRRYREDRQ